VKTGAPGRLRTSPRGLGSGTISRCRSVSKVTERSCNLLVHESIRLKNNPLHNTGSAF
jgi:hypothetical protein